MLLSDGILYDYEWPILVCMIGYVKVTNGVSASDTEQCTARVTNTKYAIRSTVTPKLNNSRCALSTILISDVGILYPYSTKSKRRCGLVHVYTTRSIMMDP